MMELASCLFCFLWKLSSSVGRLCTKFTNMVNWNIKINFVALWMCIVSKKIVYWTSQNYKQYLISFNFKAESYLKVPPTLTCLRETDGLTQHGDLISLLSCLRVERRLNYEKPSKEIFSWEWCRRWYCWRGCTEYYLQTRALHSALLQFILYLK
jgi:hypothetical protein